MENIKSEDKWNDILKWIKRKKIANSEFYSQQSWNKALLDKQYLRASVTTSIVQNSKETSSAWRKMVMLQKSKKKWTAMEKNQIYKSLLTLKL